MDLTTEKEDKSVTPSDWENPPSLRDLKQDYEEAKPIHDRQVSKIEKWLDNLHITGSAVISAAPGSSKVQPKLIRKQAEWRYAALSEPFLVASNLFDIAPVTFEDVEPARQNELVLNQQFNVNINKVEFIDNYVRTFVNEGTAIVRVGWENEEETIIENQPITQFTPNPALAPLYQELEQMKLNDPTTYDYEVPIELQEAHQLTIETGVPHEAAVVGVEEVEVTNTIKNTPTIELCDFRNIIIDPSCGGDIDKAKFIIHSFETSLSELKKIGKYSNLGNINVENNSPLGDPNHAKDTEDDNFNFKDEARKRLIAYEYWGYWDYTGSGIVQPFVATWVGDTLIHMDITPFSDGKLPFVAVPMLPVKDSVYGEPDGELLEDNQKIVGAVTRGMIDIMGKSANGQTGTSKGALDATNKRRFQQGKSYEFNPTTNPQHNFYTHVYPEIPQSAPLMLSMQQADAESMSGVKSYNDGINSGGLGEVATGIRGALDAAGRRETGIIRRLAAGLQKIGRKIVAMNSEFLSDEEIIRVTNENFVKIRRDDLAGDFDLQVNITSLDEDEAKAQELAFMFQTMGNSVDQRLSLLVLRDICRLRKMPELAKEIERFEPAPDPLQEQIKQLEILKLQKEIEELDSKINENNAQAELDRAKARETQSKTDKADLDFVEQESGVTQEREKELRQAQAQENQKLELTKYLLSKKETKDV